MELVQRSLKGRAFLLQFQQILEEFGGEIPWLEPLKEIRRVTNANSFRDKLLKGLRCDDESQIVPLQFVGSDRDREYVGGVLHFSYSPERFKDSKNRLQEERLVSEGYQFVSCLQITPSERGGKYGPELLRRTLDLILSDYGKIWAVVSEERLVRWYQSVGAEVLNSNDNKDGVWILSWQR